MAKNIVILTMGLEIGGAETHIVELAKELKTQGHNVTVFSSGGAYTEYLRENGIPHITAPMHTKRPNCLVRSYRLLADYCRHHPVSVIHSHTRITNYIAHHICRKFNIPLVTTVHGRFRLGFLQKIFSHWGDRVLAVSEDLRKYVSEGYDIDPSKVRITVNGINLRTFSKNHNPALRQQYGWTADNKIILCVSRIDPDASVSAFRLLDAATEIHRLTPEARILIVGGGKQFEQLKEKADQINKATLPGFVQLAGAQTNIADYLHAADAFVGVSRAALEAMACSLPAVLMGNGGYLGIYSKQNHDACINTNFTCRDHPHISSKELAMALTDILMHPERYTENISAARSLVEEHYSISSMVKDALASYAEAADDLRPYDLMLCGYYGTHNFGDDVTLSAIINNVAKKYPLRKVLVLCHNTKGVIKDSRIKPIHRFNLFKILPCMTKTKLFMLGGGSLLQDATSNRSIFYYLFMLFHARLLGCKTMIYGNGIGPILRKHHVRQVLSSLKKVDCITVRDAKSYKFLVDGGVTGVELTADEAYNYDFSVGNHLPNIQIPEGKKVLLVNLRTTLNLPNQMFVHVAKAIYNVSKQRNLYPILIPAQFKQDFTPLQKVSELLGDVEHKLFDKALNEQQIIALIDRCDYLLTERLHPIVFAAQLKKPFVCIAYDPKITAIARQYNAAHYAPDAQALTVDTLEALLLEIIDNEQAIRDNFSPTVEKLRATAERNSELAGQLLCQ